MADVNVFVSNWLFQKTSASAVRHRRFDDSRMKGDFNFDGSVNLADWEILNELAPPGVGSAAWAMINGDSGTERITAGSVGNCRWLAMRSAPSAGGESPKRRR